MRILPLALMILMVPTLALAHPGHAGPSFLTGLGHPLGGLDHVLAMLAVGLMAAQARGRALWVLPVTFVGAMLAGGVFGFAGVTLSAVEPLILASIIILGALVALATRPKLATLVPMVAVFGLAHGWAHGAEGPAQGLALYAAGFALATAGLHLAGIGLGRALNHLAIRTLGGGAALAGLALAIA